MTDYSVNCLYVLAMMLSGDGGTVAAKILGVMDLPGSVSMLTDSYWAIEDDISRVVIECSSQLLEEALIREVKLSTDGTDFDYEGWLRSWKEKTPFPVDEHPRITVSYDTGWNKRSNGKRHDSPSGHSVAAGQEQRLACLASVLSAFCQICSLFGDEAPAHDCAKNFNGTAGAMEPHALLTFAEEAYNKYHVVLGTIIADDDSTMRAQLKWSNEDWMRHVQQDCCSTHSIEEQQACKASQHRAFTLSNTGAKVSG